MNQVDTDIRSYPYLRQILVPELAEADASLIESYLDQRFGEGAAQHYDEYLEGFFDDLGRTFQKVAPIVTNVAGGVARGAMAGSSLGLPGIIGGAIVGGTGTALSSYGKGTARNIGNVLNTGTQVASQFSPLGRVGDQLGSTISGLSKGPITPQRLLAQGGQAVAGLAQAGIGGQAAPAMAAIGGLLGQSGGSAGQLVSMLGRPEVQQALMSLAMGPAGRQTVPVGSAQTPVPTTAITGLLQNLAAQAIDEAASTYDAGERSLHYMMNAEGAYVGDPSEDDDRAARVWDLLNQAQLERLGTLALQSQAMPPMRRYPMPYAEDWHSMLVSEWLEDIGESNAEFDAEADIESDAELDVEAFDTESSEGPLEMPYAYR